MPDQRLGARDDHLGRLQHRYSGLVTGWRLAVDHQAERKGLGDQWFEGHGERLRLLLDQAHQAQVDLHLYRDDMLAGAQARQVHPGAHGLRIAVQLRPDRAGRLEGQGDFIIRAAHDLQAGILSDDFDGDGAPEGVFFVRIGRSDGRNPHDQSQDKGQQQGS